MEEVMGDRKDDTNVNEPRSHTRALGRRDLMKLGAATVATVVGAAKTEAQGPIQGAPWPPPVRSRAGYIYDANRQGNGPMDESSRTIVQYVSRFSPTNL